MLELGLQLGLGLALGIPQNFRVLENFAKGWLKSIVLFKYTHLFYYSFPNKMLEYTPLINISKQSEELTN